MGPPIEESKDVADALRSTYEKSLKSKSKKTNEDIEMLESLKKGGSLVKEDKVAESNLMRDKNKRREKGRLNTGFQSDEAPHEEDRQQQTDKKGKLERIEDSAKLDETQTRRIKQKGRKKKKDTLDSEGEKAEKTEDSEPLLEDEARDLKAGREGGGTESVDGEAREEKAKVKKKKKKKQTDGEGEGGVRVRVPRIDTGAVEEEEDSRVLGVTVHRTDRLKQNKYVDSPLVRVHVMDAKTSDYVAKEDPKRPLKLAHEPGYEALEKFPPLCSHDFDFKKRQCLIPRWEEQLFVDERYTYFIDNKVEGVSPNTILFFEVLNYVDINQAKSSRRNSSWLRVAWAFLKLVGQNNSLNVEKKVRLQLFYPHKQFTNTEDLQSDLSDGVDLFNWYTVGRRVKYPATLYVTVKGTHVSATQMPNKTIGRLTEGESDLPDEDGKASGDEPVWSRLSGQICKVPNKLFKSLKAGKSGCSVLRFSNDGRKLACGCGDSTGGYVVMVYEIPSGKYLGQFKGHFRIIYDLCWSRSDMQLISSSQDASVLVWDVEHMRKEAVAMLTHPSYVYCAKFHPVDPKVVVSGCYDNLIRVWHLNTTPVHSTGLQSPVLLSELNSHNGFVNCLCFNSSGSNMYSCDSLGTVIIWTVRARQPTTEVSPSSTLTPIGLDFIPERTFTDPEISGVPISVVQLHGSGRRLLLQCKDNMTRVLDLRLNLIMARYSGAINFKDHIRSTFTPCGTYIFSSSEDCTAVVWNTDTCEIVCTYRDLGFTSSVSDICYHPFEHLVAFCAIGTNQPIVIFSYDKSMPERTYFDSTEAVDQMGDFQRNDTELPTGTLSGTTTPRQHSFRAKSPLLSSSAFYGPPQGGGHTGSFMVSGARLDLMGKSSRELASEIIHSVRLDQVNRQLNQSGIGDVSGMSGTMQSKARTNRRRAKQHPSNASFNSTSLPFGAGAGDATDRSLMSRTSAEDLLERSSDSVLTGGTLPRTKVTLSEQVKQVDREMPGARMSLLMQSAKPKFLVSAKTGHSTWARAVSDYVAERSDELTFSKGALVKVVMKDNENWWLGEIDNRQGYVPARCLQPVTESDAQAMALMDNEQKSALEKGVPQLDQMPGPSSVGGAEDVQAAHTDEQRKTEVDDAEVAEKGSSNQVDTHAQMGSTSRTERRRAMKARSEGKEGGAEREDRKEGESMELVDRIEELPSETADQVTDIQEEELL